MRIGKTINLPKTKVARVITIQDAQTFKTTQVDIHGWIIINPDSTLEEIQDIISKAKKDIKQRITNLAKATGLYQNENIVVIETGNVRNPSTYFSIDITIFNKLMIYDRATVIKTIEPLINEIVEIDLNNDDVFNFIPEKLQCVNERI